MSEASGTTLKITRTIAASRERVFAAFTKPEMIRQWWAPGNFSIPEVEVNPETGLGTRLVMVNDESGDRFAWSMDYTEVKAPERLVWKATFADNHETLVTVDFCKIEEGTKITLLHEKFPDSTARDNHSYGWGASLDQLEQLLN